MTVGENGENGKNTATKNSTSRPGTRRASWDVLRAVAIALVVVQHATWGGPFLVPELEERPVFLSLQAGASILMIISGYFICQTLSSSGPRALLQNRLVRVIPPMVAAAVLTHVIVHLWGPESLERSFASLIGTILVYPPGLIEGISRTDGSYWTIPLQVTAFLVTALLWPRRWRHGLRLRMTLAIAAVVPVALELVKSAGPGPSLTRGIEIAETVGAGRVHLLAAGAALWLWGTHRSGNGVLTIVAASIMTQFLTSSDVAGAVAMAVATVAIGAAARGPDWNHPVLRPVVWLAGISYGVYLVNHNIGYSVMYRLSEAGVPPMAQSAAMIVCSVMLGWLLTRLVEEPIARRFRYRRKKAAAPATIETNSSEAHRIDPHGTSTAHDTVESGARSDPATRLVESGTTAPAHTVSTTRDEAVDAGPRQAPETEARRQAGGLDYAAGREDGRSEDELPSSERAARRADSEAALYR
ncbi:acyltransferase family protein [Actinoalloteichus sp. GBA129-24]|uniref:acyltransferase family protein n=1 Tax=Actinoalloteichus sp. GBA129-24 TaxID=1612551 RepID=UPI000950B168|nr:acyltransferase [Actinoalloteichus sp. GBA129-24]APU19472.1 putative acyltransferase [Actinoalloteichus sp. GBA129-24]